MNRSVRSALLLSTVLSLIGCGRSHEAPGGAGPLPLGIQDPGSAARYPVQTPQGAWEVVVEWRDGYWWIALLQGEEVHLSAQRFSDLEFDWGQHVETADLNLDGRPDFLFTDYGGGVGLMASYCHVAMLLSGTDGYALQVVTDCGFDLQPQASAPEGRLLILTQLIQQDTPGGWGEWNRYWFELPIRVEGQTLRFAPEALPGWPRAVPIDDDTPPLAAEDPAFSERTQEALDHLFWRP